MHVDVIFALIMLSWGYAYSVIYTALFMPYFIVYCQPFHSRGLYKHSLTVDTFETIEEADRAKEALNGADIYSGCCTLKIEWGKVCTMQSLCLSFTFRMLMFAQVSSVYFIHDVLLRRFL